MPVFEIGDLIMGEVLAAAATSLSAASPFDGPCGLGYGCEWRKAATGATYWGSR
jgi:hypothetical protein